MKKWFLLALQAVVSISLLVWIFGKQDFREQALELLESADHSWLWLGFAVAGLVNLLGAFRWGIFLRVVGIPISVWETIRLSWIGLFFNSFLVGAVGGDAVKVVWLSARGHKKFPALLSVLMDRMSGLGAIVLASLVFMTLRMDWLTQSPVVARLINVVYIYLAVVVFLVVLSFVMSMKGVTNRLPNLPGKQRLLEFLSVYIEFIVCWRQTLAASLLSVVIMCAHFYTFYCCARAFGVVLPLFDFFALMPTVDIISGLPISLSGFGVREQLFATLLGDLAAVPGAQAVSISLAGGFLALIWGLVGAVLLPSYRREAKGVTLTP